MAARRTHAQEHTFEEVKETDAPPSQNLHLQDLATVRLPLNVELGVSRMKVREVLELRKGSVVALNKNAGEMTDIRLRGVLLARGEVVVIGDSLHVRVAEITGVSELEGSGDA